MADDNPGDPQNLGSQTAPWFTQQESGTTGLATTPHDSNTNILLNKIADDMGGQSEDLVAAITAIATAINAKPSA